MTAPPDAPASLTPLELARLLNDGAVQQGQMEFRLIGKGKPTRSVFMPWPIFEEHPALFTLAQVPKGYQPYYGLSLRQDASSGKAENCKVTRLLWADFDLKGTPYLDGQSNVLELEPEELRAAAQALQGDVLARCEALGLPPRLAVYTGHGLQVVWAREYATDQEDTERFNRALVAEFGEEMGADRKTVDVARVFRLPGSMNLKNPERPLPVEVWHADPSAVVNEAVLEEIAQRHAPRPAQPTLKQQAAPNVAQDGGNVIDEWNSRNPIREVLERYGYLREDDKTYTRPGDDASGRDVKLLENKRGVLCSFHHSSNDPIDGSSGDGHLREPFDLYAEYEHGGDMKAAVKAAAVELGMAYPSGGSVSVGRVPAPAKELEWREREELPPALPPAPNMPPEMLPEVLRGWLVDVAELACIPLEGVAAPAVVGLSGLIGRAAQIQPEVFGGWAVVPNLWGADVLRPSALKSMQLLAALEPLRELENQARREFEDEALDREIRLEDLKTREETLKKAGRKSGGLDVEALRELRQEAREAAPTPRRYMVQDTGYEKLGELLNENPYGLTMTRDELSGWVEVMNDERNAEARGFFLTTWNGSGSHDFDRIGRGTVRVDHMCLAVVGAIQPGPLHRFVMRSRAGSEGDVGLLQRFQLLIYPDSLGEWKRPRRHTDAQARAQAFKVYEALDTLRRAEEPLTLRFSDEAQPIFEEWRDALEHRLRGGELSGSPAFESHLGKYRSLVPSLALIFHLVEEAQAGRVSSPDPVSIDALELALNWAEYLEQHARKVYALDLGLSNGPAHDLAKKIAEGAVKDGDKLRDLRRKEWAGLKDELLGMAIEQLQAHGWVQVEEVDTGGRPSEVLRLHPDLTGGEA